MENVEELAEFLDFVKTEKRILQFEEEHDLLARYTNGDLKALEELVLANLWVAPEITGAVCRGNNIPISFRHIEEGVNVLRISIETFPMSGNLLEYVKKAVAEKIQLMIDTEKQNIFDMCLTNSGGGYGKIN